MAIPPLKQLNQKHITINISEKRRPEKACYKQAVLKIMVVHKPRGEKPRIFP
jgi:hypothetical protein